MGSSESTLQEGAREIAESCSNASRIAHKAVDALDPAAVQAAIDVAVPYFGAIDILCVWLAASKKADFLRGRFVRANWGVAELIERKEDIVGKDLLKLGLNGRPDGLS